MKKNILYMALAGVSLLFAGCNDDLGIDTPQAVEKHYGEEINFGGSASYNLAGKENGNTRTVYGGYAQGATEEPVYWVSTDQVRLFCNEAAVKTADYQVATTATDAKSMVTSTGLNKTGAAGLQWGDPESAHTFYGAYPIPSDNSLTESTTLTGTIPAVQDYNTNEEIDSDGDGNYVFAPNMEYAHMVAKTVVNDPNNIGEQVFMKFTPIATAVEIELTNNAPTNDANDVVYNFREVHLSSDTHYLSGSFTANLDNMALGGAETDAARYASGCPTGITYGNDKSKQVAVRLYDNGKAVSLTESKSLKFTVFMLPSSDGASNDDAVNDLKITLVTSEGNKTGTLNNIVIKKSKKTYMHTMPIGYEMTYNQAEWIKYVNDEKILNELSIPGAGGAASGKTGYGDTWEDDQTFLEQELDIAALWNVGIRCFEFTVDYKEIDGTNDNDLGNNVIFCNSKPCGTTTLADAVGGIKQLLMKYPKEFAMVIVTYQDNNGWNQSRNSEEFMTQLNSFWDKVSNEKNDDEDDATVYDNTWNDGTGVALYKTDLSVEEARGRLFCIARPTSAQEDDLVTLSTETKYLYSTKAVKKLKSLNQTSSDYTVGTFSNPYILVINGWGAMKDKWIARGYTSCVFHRGDYNSTGGLKKSVNGGDGELIGYIESLPGRPFDVSSSSTINTINDVTEDNVTYGYIDYLIKKEQLSPDFYYGTQTSSSHNSNTAWVAEWARVSNSSTPIAATANYVDLSGDEVSGTRYFRWANSYNERLLRAQECLDFSVTRKITYKGKTVEASNVIFINSLCGYFIENPNNSNTLLSGNSFLPNAITDYSCEYDDLKNNWYDISSTKGTYVSYLSGKSNVAGMSGNIEDFSSKINNDFLEYLKTKLDEENRLAGSTGIVLMDRVSNTTGAGAEIPSIIIANNFAPDQNATGASTYQIATSNLDLEGGDNIAAPARRNSQPSITWGEWE